MDKGSHLVFYDGVCGLCDHIVQFLLKIDTNEIFVFAPLQGETAKLYLKSEPPVDSLFLIENYKSPNHKIYIFGKGALRILWLLGGMWAILGILSFLPSFLYNWIYRFVARHRKEIWKQSVCQIPDPKYISRFLK